MLFDTFAWIEYLDGTDLGKKVQQQLDDSPAVYTCPIVLAEFTSKSLRRHTPVQTRNYTEFILNQCAVIDHTEEIGLQAGQIHAEMKKRIPDFGMADAFVLASARDRGVKVLTGDPHFQDIEDAILLQGNA